MSEPRKNHLNIDGAQPKEDEHVASYKPIPEADTEFRSSKASLHKSKEKVDEAEEKLLEKEDEAKIVTRVDMADAKYVVGDHRNGGAKIELDANKRQFSGLTKEELMKYADDPFWVRLRWAMFILFWALWLCMLAGAIVIIVQAPKCAPPPPKEWYQELALIEASDASLSDLEADLPLLQSSKVGGVFATVCNGDTYGVLASQTCLDSFKEFMVKAKEHGVKVIVDLVANYVPTTHEWFKKSEQRTPGFEDYFIWGKPNGYSGTTAREPNNWRSVTNQPAWNHSATRGEFYLSQYGEGKADLNFTNPEVVKQFDAVLKTWMQAGASGVRLSHARLLLVSSSFSDEPPVAPTDPRPRGAAPTTSDYHFYRHDRTFDQPELDGLLAHFSQVVDDNAAEPGANKSLFTTKEDYGTTAELYLLGRNVSALRPPSAAAVSVDDGAALVDKISKSLGINNVTNHAKYWPSLQLTTDELSLGSAAAALAQLLPAAPALTLHQLREFNASGTSELSRLTALRADASIQHGQVKLAVVPAVNSTEKLVAVARWKPGHTGYVAVLNSHPEELRANLTGIPVLPDSLTVHYMSPEVANLTGYATNTAVTRGAVSVPARAAAVLAFVPRAADADADADAGE